MTDAADLSRWDAPFWRGVLDAVHVGVVVTDAQERILFANAAFCHNSGLPLDEVLGRRPSELGALETDDASLHDINARLDRGEHVTFIGRIGHQERRPAEWFRMHIDSLRAPDGRVSHHVSTNVYIEAFMDAQRRLQELARRDDLTGALNRRAFNADVAVLDACTLVVLDLNGFKAVNDCFGHAAGDALLGALARALGESSAAGEQVYRLGGDEFAWVLPGDHLAEQVSLRLAGVLRAMHADAQAGPGRGQTGLAHGVAHRPHEAADLDSLYRLADRRMYLHKHGPEHVLGPG